MANRKKIDVGRDVVRALSASMPTGLTAKQVATLIEGANLPAMVDAGLVERTVRMSDRYLPTAYGRAWLALQGVG